MQATPSYLSLFLVFFRIGLTSFGGGMSGWLFREVVEKNAWLTEERFFSSLTMAQILPGPGPINASVFIGLQVRGFLGAALAFLGMVLPSFCVIILLGALYGLYGSVPAVQSVLKGLTAVGIGVTFAMGTRRTIRLRRDPIALLLILAVFLMVGILHWPTLYVVLGVIPLSIAITAMRKEKTV